LIDRWVREGLLPFIGTLLNTRPLVKLHTPLHVLQVGIWPSLLTGVSAGRLGHYVLWSQIQNGSYELRAPKLELGPLRRYETFLEDHGVGTVLCDIPTDTRISGHRGLHIVDWGTEFRFGNCQTEPRQLARRIKREVGPYPISPFRRSGDSQDEHLELARLLEEGLHLKGKLTRWLLQQPGLDHVFSVFSELHKGAHWLWKYMDRNHVDFEDSPQALRNAVQRLYESADRELAAMAAALRPQDNLIVLSEQGMQANYRANHLADAFLQALGLFACRGPLPIRADPCPRAGDAGGQRAGDRSALWHAARATKAVLPEGLTAALRRWKKRSDVDWTRTRVFSLPTDRNTYLRINLRGREPQGTVDPGAEYEKLLNHLEKELRALRICPSGHPAVAKIFRTREIFPGDRADLLPDLAVQWVADEPIDSLQSAAVGTLSLAVRELRSGNHRPEGFLLAQGPAFIKGRGELVGDILQIPATLLKVHGVSQPSQFEHGPLPILQNNVAVTRHACATPAGGKPLSGPQFCPML
jgi:predicted AlkP superfamily phosphohydrolase/phosphomutase